MAEEEPAAREESATISFVTEKPIHYYGMDDVVPVFGELAAVRHSEQVFSLFFFQTVVPITEDRAVLEGMREVPAKCVAKIVLTPKLMAEMHKAMQTNIESWQKLMQLRKEEFEKAIAERGRKE